MHLWHLKLEMKNAPEWDVVREMVVRAADEQAARRLACLNHGRETADAWLSADMTSCVELAASGEPGVILVDAYFP